MSANINIHEGKTSFVSAREIPWHQKGVILDHVFTAEEAIENANLGYNVEKRELFTTSVYTSINSKGTLDTISGQKDIKIPDMYATVRTDNNVPLGVVGSKYTVLQNKEAFKFFDSIVGEGQAIYETAGVLGKGERIFITAKLPKQLVVAPNDVIDQYLFITNSHDGSGSITAAFTTVRIVCANTLAMALSHSKHQVKFRHTLNAGNNLSQAAKMMGIAIKQGELMENNYQRMVKVKVTDGELKKFIELALKPDVEQISAEELSKRFTNTVQSVLQYAHTDETQLMHTTKGTLFGAFNAVTGYYNNVKEYKTSEDKLNQLMYGTGKTTSNRAYDLALDVLAGSYNLS